jgi:hypothetical protein
MDLGSRQDASQQSRRGLVEACDMQPPRRGQAGNPPAEHPDSFKACRWLRAYDSPGHSRCPGSSRPQLQHTVFAAAGYHRGGLDPSGSTGHDSKQGRRAWFGADGQLPGRVKLGRETAGRTHEADARAGCGLKLA